MKTARRLGLLPLWETDYFAAPRETLYAQEPEIDCRARWCYRERSRLLTVDGWLSSPTCSSGTPSINALAILFSIWLGVFSVLAVAQLCPLPSDLYSEIEGNRLFPAIALGSPIGSVFGGKIGGFALSHLGVGPLLYLAAMLLAISAMVFRVADYGACGPD